MPSDTTCKFRFMDTNYGNNNICSVSSELTDFEKTNLFNNERTRLFKFNGNFTITTSNQNLYINDGSDQTATITAGDYTASTLATEIQTQLNSVSSNFTVTYSTTTYKFTISRTSSFTLKLSSSTNDIWDVIGWVTASDLSGASSYTSEELRIHTEEWIKFSFAGQTNVGFVGLIGELDSVLDISESATITLQANNSDSWTTVAYSVSLTRTTNLLSYFIDDQDAEYKFFRILIQDKTNPLGPNLSFGHCYIGTFNNLSNNISIGFNFLNQDNSIPSATDGVNLYFDTRVKNAQMSNLTVQFLNLADKQLLEDLFSDVGITTPFFISLDPTVVISNDIEEFTKFVRFTSALTFTHERYNKYNCNFSLSEAV